MKMNEIPEAKPASPTLAAKFRNTMIAGLFIVVPIFITLWVAYWGISAMTDWAVNLYAHSGYEDFPAWPVVIRVGTILLILIGIFFVGQIAKITLGRNFIRWTQMLLLKLPLLRIVYSTCEQIGETVKSSQGGLFKQVALFEYPKKGSYAIGFITNYNEEKFEVNEHLGEDVYSIFMPTTPNPTSGFLIFIPKKECIVLRMSVSEAMTLIVSGGVILPGKKVQGQK